MQLHVKAKAKSSSSAKPPGPVVVISFHTVERPWSSAPCRRLDYSPSPPTPPWAWPWGDYSPGFERPLSGGTRSLCGDHCHLCRCYCCWRLLLAHVTQAHPVLLRIPRGVAPRRPNHHRSSPHAWRECQRARTPQATPPRLCTSPAISACCSGSSSWPAQRAQRSYIIIITFSLTWQLQCERKRVKPWWDFPSLLFFTFSFQKKLRSETDFGSRQQLSWILTFEKRLIIQTLSLDLLLVVLIDTPKFQTCPFVHIRQNDWPFHQGHMRH